jgi:HAE1 family hydrophobic/amphiphilic exporter-1
MWFLESVVKSPAKVIVGVLLVALFGTVALLRMPMQLTPEVQTPTITIETRWPGASPQEVEQEIVIEQEEQLKGVEGVVKMSSESTDSLGRITLEFLVGTPMERAVVDVIGRLEQVPQYPVDADKPVISTANASNSPIAWFILSARNPTSQQFEELLTRHPELSEPIGAIRRASSPGLAAMRLRRLSKEHPELASLLPDANLGVTKLRRFAEDEIEARFERVSGISQSNVIGGLEDELQVEIDPQKLAARQLTISDVRQVLRTQNEDTSGGDYWEGKRRWVVRTLGQFRSPQQVEQQLLAIRDGNPVYLRDVAQVRLGFKKADGLVRRFGESSIAINALRETGANVLDAMRGLQEITRQLNDGVLQQRGLQLTQVYDETEYIYESMKLVQENIFTGAALTMMVLMLFLHLEKRTLLFAPLIVASSLAAVYGSPWLFAVTVGLILVAGLWFARGALVVGLAIPTSIIGTFLILGMLGRSLNVVSLAGMAFAVGMLVDNAIVVLENIYRRWGLGQSAHQAAVEGTGEVWGAVLSSTLTTIAVFLPIVFIQEEAGQLFRDIALAISAAVGLSLIVAMTLVPMAAAKLLGTRQVLSHGANEPPASPTPLATGMLQAIGEGFIRGTVSLNRAIQNSFLSKLAVFAGTMAASIAITWFLLPKVEYLPAGNRNLVFGILLPPPGYNLDELMALGQQVESRLAPYWDVDPGTPEAAAMDFPIIGDFFFVARGRQVFMGLRAADPAEVARLVPLVQKVSAGLPGTFAVAKQSSLFEQGLSAGRTINIEITGPELPNLVALGGQLLGQTIPMFPGAQVRPIPSLDLSSPELHIRPKLIQAAQMGVSSLELGFTVNALIDGAYVTDYFLEGDKIDMTLVGKPDYAGRSQDIRALSITTPVGELVPLEALADVELSSGPEQINRRERQRAITIELSPPPEVPLEVAMQKVQDQLVQPLEAGGTLPPGYRIELAGTADKLRDTWSALRWNILLALAITYLLMVALFESWIYPLVIILTVPMGAAGGILGLQALNLFYFQTLDVLTMLGFIILIGTVVNNPILIVHQSLVHMREEGMDSKQAILESVRTRIRPIFMTTITTVLGLLPLVLFPGSGSELYRGLGAVVLGGLLLSTLLTLVVVPATFALVLDLQHAAERLWNRKKPIDQRSN